ncbi:L,D-transpeptidase family protein [Mesorhizobium sp. LHD-90]|uniref:L,D-transpeptidase family protein n=1 Tax=Mesorhizobium sp. LHD-90 TaxID=3071414 RepID=UPI0027E0836C|nr:L,D-transpeptidase family protein [Mesorhizobium sp. LHD-90]MDQ6437156.1 L,D-transpeptidase family protein [Mesorhizobium sp. LHD-90]
MTSRRGWISIASMIALSLSLVSAPSGSANAQSLFETLFGGGFKRARPSDFPPPPRKNRKAAPAQKKAAAAPKIAGPSYNTYRADRLVRVDFSPLTRGPTPIAFQAAAASGFDGALAGLEGYDLLAERDIAAALTGFYADHRAFVWVEQGAPNAHAAEAIRVLSEAASHGLDPADYLVAVPAPSESAADPNDRSADLIRFEMTLSAKVLRYAHDASMGRIDPNRISGYYDFPAKPFDPAVVLAALSNTADVRAFLETRHPSNPEYQALRVELEALQASGVQDEVTVDPRLVLKPGQTSPELPKLVHLIARDLDDDMGGKFGETLWRNAATQSYSDELVPVIKAVQQRAGLKADGIVGPRTVNAVAGTSNADKIEKVRIALEQLRWLPSDLGSPRVFVNQPAFTASYIDGVEKLNMRVVIGAPSTQTSFFYDEIEQVDYNPYWGVPQSIIVNEMLPRLRRDPGYLDRAGYEVTDSKGRRIPSSSINWGRYGGAVPFSVRQTPSEANALGELKILFPNEHAIYMHDTPVKNLFQRDTRAFSHGCIRLQDPRGMAAAVLDTSVDHIAAKLKRGHSTEKVTRKIPVYVAYFTAWPTISGKVEYFGDIYDRDTKLKLAIAATEAARAPGS